MHDIVPVAILQCTSNLPRELARNALPQPPMTDDIVQHLTTIDILEHHVIMMLVNDQFTHAAYIWVI